MFPMKIWCVEHDRAPVLEEPPWEGFVPGINFWFSVCPSSCGSSSEFTPPQPRVPVAGPSSVSPTVAVATSPASVSPPLAAGSVPEDVVSLQEGGGSFYESTLPEVWINGDKIEPAQASQFITRTIQAHFPGPIHRFNDFP
ncbi:hypothetical protein Taro_045144, partial [Colocasia esculenta]|nr:hypothetical protein [Colocasia esculenta]